jgi:hypothetical protein
MGKGAREAVLLGLVLGGTGCQRATPLTLAHALAIDEEAGGEIVLPAPRTRVPLGAFDDDAVRAVVHADASATPLYVIPVGKR